MFWTEFGKGYCVLMDQPKFSSNKVHYKHLLEHPAKNRKPATLLFIVCY